jgi:hypothetical protein
MLLPGLSHARIYNWHLVIAGGSQLERGSAAPTRKKRSSSLIDA